MIPKIAHFVWFGKHRSWVQDNIDVFIRHHPDWDVRVYTGTDNWLDLVPEALHKAAIDAPKLCTRSDLISYGVLQKVGGVYLDVDCVALRSFDTLLDCDFFVGHQNDGQVNCAVMGSIPGSEAINKIVDSCIEIVKNKERITRMTFGPALLTRVFKDKEFERTDVFPKQYFYPHFSPTSVKHLWLMPEQRRMQLLRKYLTKGKPDPYSLHLYGVDSSNHRKPRGYRDALAYRLIKHFGFDEEIVGAEVGVNRGALSEHVLMLCPKLKLFMVDRWEPCTSSDSYYQSVNGSHCSAKWVESAKKEATQRTNFASGRRLMLKGASVDMIEYILDETLDFVFIDAEHTYDAVLEDLNAWYPKVRSGGLIGGHDIDNPKSKKFNKKWDVRKAVEQFIKEKDIKQGFEVGAGTAFFFEKP